MEEKTMDTQSMIRGLVRAAEMIEQRDAEGQDALFKKEVWDDEVRGALEAARQLGWGNHRIGRLGPVGEEKPKEFEPELAALINRLSLENESGTPDFLLASYLRDCLTTWGKHVRQRDEWYRRQ